MNISPNIPEFDSWFDGNMTIAKKIVETFANSKDFTLMHYPKQEEFYNDYLSKYTDFVNSLSKQAYIRGINLESELFVLNKIMEALLVLKEKGTLTYAHFLAAYMQILIYMDTLKTGYPPMYPLSRDPINKQSGVEDILKVLNNFAKAHPRIVPFTSKTGVFGINTFLYLYFNNIYPVAVATDPYPVHEGSYTGSIAVMYHDFLHNGSIKANTSNTYYNTLKEVYIRILQNKRIIGSDTVKLLLAYIFDLHHESDNPTMITCSNIHPSESNHVDFVPALLRIKTYSPERYGLNSDVINRYFNDKNQENIVQIYTYNSKVKEEAHRILCELADDILPHA